MGAPETQGDELGAQDSLFSCEDASAQASLQWIQDHSEQPFAAKLLAQISEWDDVVNLSTGKRKVVRQLALQHGILAGRASRTVPEILESARSHFLAAIRTSKEHMQAFAGFKRGAPQAVQAATQQRMRWSEVESFSTLARFAYQEEGLPEDLRKVIRYLNGGMPISW